MEKIVKDISSQDLDYVNILQEHVSNCFNQKSRLLETRGIVLDIDFIVNKIMSIIKTNLKTFQIGKKKQFKDIRTKEDYFIDHVNLSVGFLPIEDDKYKMQSFFNDDNCRFIRNKNGKIIMYYPYFDFIEFVPSILRKVVLNKEVFSVNVWHEVMHCYRTYKISIDNDIQYPKSLKNNDRLYKKAVTMYRSSPKNPCENMAKWIGNTYYKMNKNEIASQTNSIYGYIKSNPNINVDNYKNFLDKMDLKITYNQILSLYNYIEKIRQRGENDDERKCIISILRSLFENYSDKDSLLLKKTSNNIKYYLSYINNKMYAAIEYSLMVLRRNGITNEMRSYNTDWIINVEQPKWED